MRLQHVDFEEYICVPVDADIFFVFIYLYFFVERGIFGESQ